MALELQYPHIEKVTGEPARLQRLPRVRVSQLVAEYLAYAWPPDEICRQHPDLTPAEVHAAMTYYFDHQSEIEAEIKAELDEFDRQIAATKDSALRLRLRAEGLR